jgi:hypothetical protein
LGIECKFGAEYGKSGRSNQLPLPVGCLHWQRALTKTFISFHRHYLNLLQVCGGLGAKRLSISASGFQNSPGSNKTVKDKNCCGSEAIKGIGAAQLRCLEQFRVQDWGLFG